MKNLFDEKWKVADQIKVEEQAECQRKVEINEVKSEHQYEENHFEANEVVKFNKSM